MTLQQAPQELGRKRLFYSQMEEVLCRFKSVKTNAFMACDTAKHEGEKPPPSLLHSRIIRNVEREGVVDVENCKKEAPVTRTFR